MKHPDLAKILVERSYLRAPPGKPFLLASGDRSDFYFDCQRTTLSAAAFPLLGAAFIETFADLGLYPESVGGLVLGADPIAIAVMAASIGSGMRSIDSFRIRKEKKSHGTQNWLEGSAAKGTTVVVVDDVVTRGSSVVQAIETCRKESLDVLGCVVLVDREQGGMEKIAEALNGAPYAALFTWSSLKPLIGQKYGRDPHSRLD